MLTSGRVAGVRGDPHAFVQQQCPAVLGMIEPLLDAAQIAHQEGRPHLAATAAWQFCFQHVEQHAAHAFQEFEQHVAREAIAHHHVKHHILNLMYRFIVYDRYIKPWIHGVVVGLYG